MLVSFLDGRVPCLRWAWVRRRSGHSEADRVVNGRLGRSRIPCVIVVRTTESSVRMMKLQIWHLGWLHSGAFRLAKSEAMFEDLAR